MDLQKILSHRETCFICQEKLIYSLPLYPNLQYSTDSKGFHIRSGHAQGIKMDFNFDGSYQRNKRNYSIYRDTLRIRKICINCFDPTAGIITNQKGNIQTTDTTINNIGNKEYSYCFNLVQQEDKYAVTLTCETARYQGNEEFFHIYVNHGSYGHVPHSQLHHANFDKRVEDILNLRIPGAINLSNVNNVEEFVSKCKTLINFS
jgi:hypothetical protein